MSPKKSTRSQAAQQLIENLLDELPPSKSLSRVENERELAMGEGDQSFGPVDEESDGRIVIDNIDDDGGGLHLEQSGKVHLDPVAKAEQDARKEKAPFDGESPVVTQMAQRSKITRPDSNKIIKEERVRPEADIDFGEMSSEDPFKAESVSPLAHDLDDEAPSYDRAEFIAPPESNSSTQEDERTVRMSTNGPGTLASPPEPRPDRHSEVIPISRSIDRGGATEIRQGIKIPPSPKFAAGGNSGSAPTSIEATLKQSESLRIAQTRITDLERELERVRRDNEQLSTAGDTLRRRSDELAGKAEALEIHAREMAIRLDEEKKVLRGQLQAKDRDNSEMKSRVEEIETRLESNFKKIRVRERELEHRLEIVKMETATVVSTKDKMLLDLKRQIDQLHQESDSAKSKSQEMFSQYKEKQDTIRRVVRALRIALTILEGDDETVVPNRKAE